MRRQQSRATRALVQSALIICASASRCSDFFRLNGHPRQFLGRAVHVNRYFVVTLLGPGPVQVWGASHFDDNQSLRGLHGLGS